MDLQARKLHVIEYLIKLQDESLFSKIESIIQSKMDEKNELKSFTKEEYIQRAEESKADYVAGRTISQEDLESQSKKW